MSNKIKNVSEDEDYLQRLFKTSEEDRVFTIILTGKNEATLFYAIFPDPPREASLSVEQIDWLKRIMKANGIDFSSFVEKQ